MNEQMDCMRYRAHLDEWIDGMLDEETAAQMQAHADSCPDCAEEARLLRETLNMLHSLDDDISVPLQTQAAWRKAVRTEARRQRSKRFSGIFRAAGSVAAALVVLAGCTGIFRMNGMLPPDSSRPAAVMPIAAENDAPAYFTMIATGQNQGKARNAAPTAYIASDGAAEADAVPMTRSVPGEEILPAATQAPTLIRSVERTILTDNFDGASQNIRDLTEQYCGYLADDAVTTAANGLRTGAFTAVIPALDADNFLQAIDHIGNVTYTAEHFDDVSDDIRDVQARLDAIDAELLRLNELLASAQSADEIAQLSAQIQAALTRSDEIQSEAVRLKTDTDNVRISIILEELFSAASASPTITPELAQRMGAAFSQSAQNLQSFLRDMAVSLMIIAPFLIAVLLIAAVVFAVILIRRKH